MAPHTEALSVVASLEVDEENAHEKDGNELRREVHISEDVLLVEVAEDTVSLFEHSHDQLSEVVETTVGFVEASEGGEGECHR